jgi:enoyl-CoA hydratase/carnithine racemase
LSLVRISFDGPLATLTLARPEARNALSADLCAEIIAGLEEIDRRVETRIVVVAGEGKSFCAGADFAAVSGPEASGFLTAFESMLEAVARFRLPTIARIHGAALGGGFQLATVCDFRIASEDAKLGIPSARLGIVVNFENVQRLVLLAGIAVTKEVLMTARNFTGEEATLAGLVNSAHPIEELEGAVGELAGRIAELAPLSVQGVKRAIGVVGDRMAASRSGSSGAPEDIDRLVEEAYRSVDLAEGLRAKTEKRPPNFSGH